MRIAISAAGNGLDAPLDIRFGRAPGFVIVDTDVSATTYLVNQDNLEATQGAGTKTAQMLMDRGVDQIISGLVGPKAFRLLAQAGIQIYNSDSVTVRQALEDWDQGLLREQEP